MNAKLDELMAEQEALRAVVDAVGRVYRLIGTRTPSSLAEAESWARCESVRLSFEIDRTRRDS